MKNTAGPVGTACRKILIRGAGDLATGIGWELFHDGHRVVMTDLPVPLTVRRQVAFSRAIYEGTAQVEGVTAVLARDAEDAERILDEGMLPVLADPEGKVREAWSPEVVVDAIMAKHNIDTTIDDAPLVIAIGPGFTAGVDCDFVIETVRGPHLGEVIRDGSALPDTGVPGIVGGYTVERLLRASADGIMEPWAAIGDIVEKGQIVAMTGGEPVYAQLHGVVRGMLQPGVPVTRGLKIGDVDARLRRELAFTISDKSHRIGCGVREAIRTWEEEKRSAVR